MMRFPDRWVVLVPALVLFAVPLNIYVIGEWIGSGVQWALFRYQETSYGASFISLDRDLWYITSGLITGKSAIAISLWVAGVALLAISCIALAAVIAERVGDRMQVPGLMLIGSGILLLSSSLVQYGPLLSGPAGFSIPVGIPLVWAAGWLIIIQDTQERYEGEEGERGEDFIDE